MCKLCVSLTNLTFKMVFLFEFNQKKSVYLSQIMPLKIICKFPFDKYNIWINTNGSLNKKKQSSKLVVNLPN